MVSHGVVLIVDDDDASRRALARDFSSRGWQARGAASADEGLRSLGEVDLVVLDLHLGAESGLALLEHLREHGHERDAGPDVVVVSGYASIATTVDAMRLGARSVVPKPVDADAILASLKTPVPGTEPPPLPSLHRTEWEHIQRALQETQGNVSEAARRLGIPRRTLQRKLRKRPPA